MRNFADQIIAEFDKAEQMKPTIERIYSGGFSGRLALREFYSEVKGYEWYPYDIDWLKVLESPIEDLLFDEIRYHGIPAYPQYPVGKYFVDFGDPKKRIAIEADGKQYHDEARDAARDLALMDYGWSVFRISGSDIYKGKAEDFVLSIKQSHYANTNPVFAME